MSVNSIVRKCVFTVFDFRKINIASLYRSKLFSFGSAAWRADERFERDADRRFGGVVDYMIVLFSRTYGLDDIDGVPITFVPAAAAAATVPLVDDDIDGIPM